MGILQSTFDKHKRLMLENLGVINETELYHASKKSDIESFVKNGVRPDMAGREHGGAGKNQGSGFYLFKEKSRAIKHAHDDGRDTIVVIDVPINIQNFDLDYEGEFLKVMKFMATHWDFFSKHWEELGIRHHILKTKPPSPTMKGVFSLSFDGKSTSSLNANNPGHIGADKDIIPEAIWKMVQVWKKINPALFNKFESENIEDAEVLKYNSDKKIWPTRIEDLDGNILWKPENK